ncbi:histidine phosphatase family protein [Nocardioides sp. JQ2195]|uniref:histidine phosphatase family protein n=1 Tax=Nocardioides sp. JQ2195 TaxID=2592334 RepID=UPI00143EC854|nr:histidine phosphatase family protein [Nocardioides sp. JQ2195]QIX26261.1 histidine phosphatase family protein [Nocardioides sp. JQ2195]
MSDLQCASRIVLARHGEAEYESDLLTDEGGSLTHLGRRQAVELAEKLAGRKVAHVWTSTLARAVQTGEIVAATLGVAVSTRSALDEFSCGEYAGLPRADDPFAETYLRWLEGELDTRAPGAETGTEGIERLRATLSDIADQYRGESVLVISHGGLLRLGVPALARMSGIEMTRLDNCDTIEIDIDGDGWVCRSWG